MWNDNEWDLPQAESKPETETMRLWREACELRGRNRARRDRILGAPDWLAWKVITKPPGPVNREFTREARNKLNRSLREQLLTRDYDDISFEHRPSRLDARRWWY